MTQDRSWDLKTQSQEAVIQIALQALAAYDIEFTNKMQATSESENLPKEINEIFTHAEFNMSEKIQQIMINCESFLLQVDRTKDTEEVNKKLIEHGMLLTTLAGLALNLANNYLKLAAIKAGDENPILECKVLTNEDFTDKSLANFLSPKGKLN